MGENQGLDADRENIYAALGELNAYAFWQIQGEMEPREPRVRERPHVWRYKDFEPHILRAGEVVPHELADRRGLILHNPGYDMTRPYTTNTLYAAYSVYMPGEVFEPHVHSPSASRMVLHCDGKGYTTVDGEKAYLERGDLITTPSGAWHDHGNEGSEPMIWVDMLDIPIPVLFNASKFGFDYQENGVTRDSQSQSRSKLYSKRHFASGGLRPRFARQTVGNDNASPQMHFKYKDVRAALDGLRDEEGDPYDGVILDYVNVMTGGPLHRTQNFSMQMLRPKEHTLSHRHTNNALYVCLEGAGKTVVNGEDYHWGESDVFCVPSHQWHEHINLSADGDAVLYCVTDSPAVEALGLLWEERRLPGGGTDIIGKSIPV
ncbi:MAG: cupin domain-containing protein [Pseudomonadota bacterium]